MLSFLILALACTTYEDTVDETIGLVVDNQTGNQLWVFDYRGCGESDWYYVIASDEYVANGDKVAERGIEPGCYEIYVEDEEGCTYESDTDGNVKAGRQITWTVRSDDLWCSWF